MRRAAVLIAATLATLAVAVVPAAGAKARVAIAAVQLRAENGSGVRGAGFFRQSGKRVSGWVVVWGLARGSAHAVHFHGPHSGSCVGASADPIAAHADLVADANGVAFRSFSFQTTVMVVRRGVYYNVHEKPSVEKSPSVACADLRRERAG